MDNMTDDFKRQTDLVMEKYHDCYRSKCEGCREGWASQRDHDCCREPDSLYSFYCMSEALNELLPNGQITPEVHKQILSQELKLTTN